MDKTDDKSEKLEFDQEMFDEFTKNLTLPCLKPHSANAEEGNDSWDIPDSVQDNINKDDNAQSTRKVLTEDVDEEFLKDRDLSLSQSEQEAIKTEAEKLKQLGNDYFKNGEYVQAITQYTQALQICPLAYSQERSILYANRAAARAKCQAEKDSAISDCTKAIELNSSYLKAYSRRAQLYEETDKLDESLEDFKKVLTFDPSHTEANHAIRRLPPLIEQRNEKLKTEMMGKLKELGNMVLRPFGLSTNNFELQQDPNSGGYSVKFNQNST